MSPCFVFGALDVKGNGWIVPGQAWTKADLISYLARFRGYRSYLEICTATTGARFGEIEPGLLSTSHRLMYRCPADFSDGHDVHFRSGDLNISECLRTIRAASLHYDVILVDSFHDYDCSYRDLAAAFDLLRTGGTIVVHDCLPPDEAHAMPQFQPGGWCGVSYKAYLDFVLGRRDLDFFTVDTDFGCGIVQKRSVTARIFGGLTRPDETTKTLLRQWKAIGDDYPRAFRFLQQNAVTLLKLKSVEEFQIVVQK